MTTVILRRRTRESVGSKASWRRCVPAQRMHNYIHFLQLLSKSTVDYHRLGGSKQQQCTASQFQLEAQQGSPRAKIKVMDRVAFPSGGSRRESFPGFF